MARKKGSHEITPAPAYNFGSAMENNFFGKKLQDARKARKLTLANVKELMKARGLDIGIGAINRWEVGPNIPGAYHFAALCDIYSISDPILYFTGRAPLNDEGMRKLNDYKEDLIASGRYAPTSEAEIIYINMPVHFMAASAGPGNFLDGDNFEYHTVPKDLVPEGADFGIKIAGDSMEPNYYTGDIAWVKKCSTLRRGEVGIFTYDGEGYIKQYSEKTPADPEPYTDSYGVMHMQPVLVSLNKKYRPIEISADKEFTIVGRVLS